MFLFGYFLLFLISLLLFIIYSRRRPKNFPPGPTGYPIVGNAFQLTKHRHLTCIEFGRKYGDILGFQLGPTKMVVLNNYQHIKEAFNEPVFNGRPMSAFIETRNRGKMRGVAFNQGQNWQEQRRFCLKTFRDFGFGKKSIEVLVMEEVNELIESLIKTKGQPISTRNCFNGAVLNALWQIVAGIRYSHDDPKLQDLFKLLTSIVGKPSILLILGQFLPIIGQLQKKFPKIFPNQVKELVDPLYQFFDEIIAEHKKTYQEGSPRDFIDVYFDMMAKSTDPHSSFYKDEGEQALPVVCLDVFVAGVETTSTTLTWACLLLALNPQAQEKLYKEIGKVVENSRHVSLTDRPNIPYLEATIMEVMRFSALTPMNLPHATTEDTTFHGYSIPKGTVIHANLYAVSRDESVWKDPQIFRPERFLSADGSTLIRNEALIPFSTGKRVCLGQTLALDELFLFMGNLFQRFQMKLVGKLEEPLAQDASFIILMPKAHQLSLIERLK